MPYPVSPGFITKETNVMFGSHRFRDKVSQSTGLREMGERMRHAAGDRLESVREGAADLLEEGRTRARHAERTARRYVKDRPLSALLLAFGIGAVAGVFLKKR
jgi:ElaB/YqjD/DUF883 family membrane-anchored ribosome-binding protein